MNRGGAYTCISLFECYITSQLTTVILDKPGFRELQGHTCRCRMKQTRMRSKMSGNPLGK